MIIIKTRKYKTYTSISNDVSIRLQEYTCMCEVIWRSDCYIIMNGFSYTNLSYLLLFKTEDLYSIFTPKGTERQECKVARIMLDKASYIEPDDVSNSFRLSKEEKIMFNDAFHNKSFNIFQDVIDMNNALHEVCQYDYEAVEFVKKLEYIDRYKPKKVPVIIPDYTKLPD